MYTISLITVETLSFIFLFFNPHMLIGIVSVLIGKNLLSLLFFYDTLFYKHSMRIKGNSMETITRIYFDFLNNIFFHLLICRIIIEHLDIKISNRFHIIFFTLHLLCSIPESMPYQGLIRLLVPFITIFVICFPNIKKHRFYTVFSFKNSFLKCGARSFVRQIHLF